MMMMMMMITVTKFCPTLGCKAPNLGVLQHPVFHPRAATRYQSSVCNQVFQRVTSTYD